MDFYSAYAQGFARIAAVTLPVHLADPAANAEAVLAAARECDGEAVAVAVFPELCLTGYAIDDLVMQDAVLDAVEASIARLVEASVDLFPMLVVGAPLRQLGVETRPTALGLLAQLAQPGAALVQLGVQLVPGGAVLATPAATVPTPISDTSFTDTSAAGFVFFKSKISCARSSME